MAGPTSDYEQSALYPCLCDAFESQQCPRVKCKEGGLSSHLSPCPAVHDGLAEPAGLADPQGDFFLPPLWTHAGLLAASLAADPVGCSPSEAAWLLGSSG